MDSTSNTSPEHDEKTGSFAPRTAGTQPQRPEKKSWRPTKLTLALMAAGLLVVLILLWQFVYLPRQEKERNRLHPAREVFALSLDLNLEEELHGLGSAAEPPIEKRLMVEQVMKKMYKKFPDIKAVVTRCILSQHDIHLIDPTGRILTHFMENEDVPTEYAEARQIFQTLPYEENYVLIVKNDKTLIYDAQGNLK